MSAGIILNSSFFQGAFIITFRIKELEEKVKAPPPEKAKAPPPEKAKAPPEKAKVLTSSLSIAFKVSRFPGFLLIFCFLTP